ncbi:hypothetical protein ASPSYDRAFT_57174 [Aspergillus sydowii CBS 593.65]|uniref:HORMA domain-containing protein n=1 Tax=Aspergillus sydowii CBS 593.65 TaxID=1036612 RepID=A0A1L9TJK4_9EURO|nr:uncharacterized protein ASPSYDRAFT_57174 [Aspergillus sydowii CBS 593.65]OJJ59606.1 hypothetical protein ASPSYDRAFT_57174 [Aspergillus sydowii CBS 593.65]
MVRIKFTGPPMAARSQLAQPCGLLPSNGTTPASSPVIESRAAMDGLDALSAEENRVLQQQQSLEMVKIMLHVSFGTLFYLREFLPLQCFDDRDLREAQKQQKFSYREFIDNSPISKGLNGVADDSFGKAKRGQPLKIILRGSEPKADMIINVLETGIFDALSKSVLEAVQLTIIADKEAPDNVLESYTFSFRYTDGLGDINRRLKTLSIEPCGYVADMKSAQTARVGLETIVRRLITLSAFLPTLPNKRTLGVHLFYTEDCPPDYEPPGFNGARDGTINYPLTENWRRESQACGKMESGSHTVGLKVTSLKWTGPEPEDSEPIPPIPTDIEYKDTVPRAEDIGFEDEESKLRSSQIEVGSSQEATQDVVERERLRMMMPSQEEPSSESNLIPTQPVKQTPIPEAESVEVARPSPKFALGGEKIAELRKTSQNSAQRRSGPAAIRCQCDWTGEEEDMIVCSFCNTQQHRLCYGYVGVYNHSVPDIHACYRCLLEPNESQILNSLGNIILARKTLKIVSEVGILGSAQEFCEKTHCSPPAFARVKEFLKRKAIMQPTPGYKPKECIRKGLPTFIVPEKPKVREIIQRDIMNPMVKIEHHYTIRYFTGPLEAHRPPATSDADGLSNQNSQNSVVTAVKNSQDDQLRTTKDTRDDESQELGTPQRALSSRRRTRSSNVVSVIEDSQSTDNSTPQRSTRKRTRSSQVGPEPVRPVTPSHSTASDNEVDTDKPRRSSRKRRKISNYSKLIDVGAETSGNE